MTTPTFVRAYPSSGTIGGLNTSPVNVTVDTTGLGANGAVVVFITAGRVGGNMTGASFSAPTLGGSSTGWSEYIPLTLCGPGTTGAAGCWVCLNPSSNASQTLAVTHPGGSGGTGTQLAYVVGMYSDVASVTAFTVDNDSGSESTETITNSAGANALTVGAWTHGSNISSVTSGTLRGVINNWAQDTANGCIVFIEGNTAAFSSGSSDTNLGMQVKLLGSTGVPSQVSEVRAVAENDGASLIWTVPSDGGSAITDYLIEKNVNSGGWTTVTHSTQTNPDYHVTGLSTNDSVIFRVSAVNANGTGTASPSSPAITVLGIRSIAHIMTPLVGHYLNTSRKRYSSASVVGANNTRTRPRLIRSSNAGAVGTTWDSAGAGISNDYLWTTIIASQSVTAQIGTLVFSGIAGAPCNTPDAPTSLAATPGSTQVGLTWTAPSGTITDYVIQYRTSGGGVSFPTAVDSTNRKLLNSNGNPVMIHTFSSWGMAGNLSDANITVALEAIQALGFNAVTVIPCQSMDYGGAGGAQWHPYQNLAGNPFFTGSAFASSFGSAWSSMDWVMTEATRLGMHVLISLYSGSGNGQGGNEIISAGTTNMYNYGVSLATRYASYSNIIWHFGADQDFNYGTNPSTMVDAYFHGIQDTEGGTHRLVVAEPGQYPTTSYNQFNNQGYTYFNTDVNNVYHYFDGTNNAISHFDSSWNESGATSMPVWDCEPPYLQAPYYSDENSGQRARHYTTYIRGGCGINLSDEAWWPFGKNPIFGSGSWTATPAKAMVIEMGYAIYLIDSYMLDLTWAPVSTFVTTGASTDVAQGASSSAAIAYIPSSRTLALDTTIIAGTGNVRLRWFDPSNNTYTTIAASEAQQTGRSITHPGSNSVGDTDWLVVVDDGTTHTPPSTAGSWTTFSDGTSTATSTTVTGLTNGTSYDFRVAAVTACGQGIYSTTVTSTPVSTQTTNAQIGSLTFTGIAGTPTPGAVSKTNQVGALTFSGIAGTTTGGPVSKTAQIGSLTFTGIAGTPTPGNFNQTAQIGALTFTGIAGTTSGGPVSKTAQVGSLTFSGIAGSISSNFTQNAQIGTLTFSGIAGSTVGGPVSKTAQIGALTFSGIAGTPTPGNFNQNAQIGNLTFTPLAGTTIGGPASQTAQIGTLTFSGIAGTISSNFTQNAQIGILTFSGIAGTTVGGPTSLTAQIGILTFEGVPGTAGTGLFKAAQTGFLTFTGVPGTPTGGPVSKTAQIGSLAFSGIQGIATPGNATTNAQQGLITFTGIPGSEIGGPTSLTAQTGILTFVGIPGTPGSGGSQVVAQIGILTFDAISGTTTGGPASQVAQIGLLTFSGIPGNPSNSGPGPQFMNAQVGLLTFAGIPGTVFFDQTTVAQIAGLTFIGIPGNVTGAPIVQAQIGLLTFEGVPGHPFLGAVVVDGYGRIGIIRFSEPGIIRWTEPH